MIAILGSAPASSSSAANSASLYVEALQVLSLAAVVGLNLDLLLELIGHLLLSLAAVHPVGFRLAVETVDLELGAPLADGPSLVALFAAQATSPAALGTADLG